MRNVPSFALPALTRKARMFDALFGTVLLLLGLFLGWIWAHSEVATECERQGSFSVAERNFTCSRKP